MAHGIPLRSGAGRGRPAAGRENGGRLEGCLRRFPATGPGEVILSADGKEIAGRSC